MEEALVGVQTGAIKTLQLTHAQDKLKFDDHSYIQVSAHWMQSVSAKWSHVQTFHPPSRLRGICYCSHVQCKGFGIHSFVCLCAQTYRHVPLIPRLAQAHEGVQACIDVLYKTVHVHLPVLSSAILAYTLPDTVAQDERHEEPS